MQKNYVECMTECLDKYRYLIDLVNRAEDGDPGAMLDYFMAIAREDMVEKGYVGDEEALEYLRRAVELGYAPAVTVYVWMLITGCIPEVDEFIGVPLPH